MADRLEELANFTLPSRRVPSSFRASKTFVSSSQAVSCSLTSMSLTARSPPTLTSSTATTSLSCAFETVSRRPVPTFCSSLWSWALPTTTNHEISLYRFYSGFNAEERICAPLGGQKLEDMDVRCSLTYSGYGCPTGFSNVGASIAGQNNKIYTYTTICCLKYDCLAPRQVTRETNEELMLAVIVMSLA